MRLLTHLLRQSWTVATTSPTLLVYGLFLAILGQGGVSEVVLRLSSSFVADPAELRLRDLLFSREFWTSGALRQTFEYALNPHQPIAFLTLLVLLLLVLAVFAGIILSMAAVPLATRAASERRKRLDIAELAIAARAFFWPVTAVFALSSVTFWGLLELFDVLGRAIAEGSAARFLMIPLFLLFVIASVVVFFTALYATNAIALRRASVGTAFAEAMRILAAHWMVSLEFGLLFFLLNILAAVLTVWLMVPVMWLVLLLAYVFTASGFGLLGQSVFVFGIFLLTVLGISAMAFYATFQTAFWTLAYLFLSGRSAAKQRFHSFSPLKLEAKGSPL